MSNPISILVVDDESGICQNVRKILSKDNFNVTSAAGGREALDKMAQKRFDLVISDVVMPEMNGLQFLKSLKSKWPDTKTVMMTAYASTDTAMRAIRLGALDYLPKPFTPAELRSMVEQALAGRLVEAQVDPTEREAISVSDVAPSTAVVEPAPSTDEAPGLSDHAGAPMVEITADTALEGFCDVGTMVCDIFKKLGATCKAGTKTGQCPQKKAKKSKANIIETKTDVKTLIGVDQPFNYDDVQAVTGPEYLSYLRHDGVVIPTYEELKANVARLMAEPAVAAQPIQPQRLADDEMAAPAAVVSIEMKADPGLEGFCEVGTMVCDIFKKLGATCKAGTKTGECPQKKARKGKSRSATTDTRRLINPDLPFDYEEVAAVAGPDYVRHLVYDGVVQIPYEQLKADFLALSARDGKAAAPAAAPLEKAGKNSALVIDDEMAVNNNIRKILAKKQFTVDQAATKEEALAKIAARAYELVLLDLRIPGVQGLELLRAIREAQPEARVIIVTGYASIETAKETARMGAVGYLPKPFTPGEIRGATEKAMQLAA